MLDARRFAKKRVARLLVPFLLCAVLWTIPLKYIAGYWDGSIDVCRDIVVGQILLQGNTHLWFLPTLYAISIIHLLIERYLPGHVGLKVIGLLLASLCSSAIPLEFISLVLRHYVWYYLGWLFENSGLRNKLANGHGHRRLLMFAAAGFLVSFGLYYWLGYDSGMPLTMLLLRRLLAYVCTLFGSALTYLLALSLSEKQGSLTHRLSSSSFELYLYSDPLNYVILGLAASTCGAMAFTGWGYVALFFVRLITTTIISLLVGYLVSKLKAIISKSIKREFR